MQPTRYAAMLKCKSGEVNATEGGQLQESMMHGLIGGRFGDLYRAGIRDLARRPYKEARPSGSGQMSPRDLARMLLASGGHLSLAFGMFFRTIPDLHYLAEPEHVHHHRRSARL